MSSKYEFTSNKRAASVRPTVVKELNRVGVRVFNASQRLAPVDTGNLKASGRLEPATPQTLKTSISYGGTAAQYAAAVHELHATRSKYLETPARANRDRFLRDLGAALRAATQ